MMRKGFTLIELLVVITIIAILSAIGMVSYQKVSQNGRDGKRQADLKQIQSALEQYFADQFFYPSYLIYDSALTNLMGRSLPTFPPEPKSYLNKVSCDPSTGCTLDTGVQYCYVALPVNCTNGTTANSKCTNYKLYARLENPSGNVTYYNDYNSNCGVPNNTYNLEVTRP